MRGCFRHLNFDKFAEWNVLNSTCGGLRPINSCRLFWRSTSVVGGAKITMKQHCNRVSCRIYMTMIFSVQIGNSTAMHWRNIIQVTKTLHNTRLDTSARINPFTRSQCTVGLFAVDIDALWNRSIRNYKNKHKSFGDILTGVNTIRDRKGRSVDRNVHTCYYLRL